MPCDAVNVDPSTELLALAADSGWVRDLADGLIVPVTVDGVQVAELVPAGHLPHRARQLVEVRRLSRDGHRGLAAAIAGGFCVALRVDGRIVGLLRPAP